jgi:hypothetical protein
LRRSCLAFSLTLSASMVCKCALRAKRRGAPAGLEASLDRGLVGPGGKSAAENDLNVGAGGTLRRRGVPARPEFARDSGFDRVGVGASSRRDSPITAGGRPAPMSMRSPASGPDKLFFA